MKELNRDKAILEKMLKYCNQIDEAHETYGTSYEIFEKNSVYHNAVCMCLMQIGELANHLSDEFKVKHNQIPWNAIRGMRNIVAHEYGNIDYEIVWETATEEIKVLYEFCIEQM